MAMMPTTATIATPIAAIAASMAFFGFVIIQLLTALFILISVLIDGVVPNLVMEFVKCWTQNSKGTVIMVLPKTVRDELGIKPNDRFLMTTDKKGDRIILKKVDE